MKYTIIKEKLDTRLNVGSLTDKGVIKRYSPIGFSHWEINDDRFYGPDLTHIEISIENSEHKLNCHIDLQSHLLDLLNKGINEIDRNDFEIKWTDGTRLSKSLSDLDVNAMSDNESKYYLIATKIHVCKNDNCPNKQNCKSLK